MDWNIILLMFAGLLLIMRMMYSLNTTRRYSFRNTLIIKRRKSAFIFGLIGIAGLVGCLLTFVTK
ncbi:MULTISPECIES: hypothetical protein [Fictibacillus]|uniref:Uncharacterized protein n=1 Tax=Fictibacillus terranigra TaxID=3058424 RepID=A0ABT8ED21_9BACL|nr:hypothetical protein [Fictibacillus sp. CENA-BCM004]MDN4075739.1 hypothetical protein [Fictibacillus sp. CENA-BCM004]